ncbi:MAG TPA: YcaO-like family protein, partial [Rhodopila sp.]|nr:YcaO-like family protein [Rhodopila sp.]
MSIPPRQELLEHCAQALLDGTPPEQQTEPVRAFLAALGYAHAPASAAPGDNPLHHARLLRAAAGFSRLFQLRSPDAPGLVFFGAQVAPAAVAPGGQGQRPLPASGVGPTLREAFEGCVGEGIEHLSQFERTDDRLVRATISQAGHAAAMATEECIVLLAQSGLPPTTSLDWIVARRLPDGQERLFPADICLRRHQGRVLRPSWPLSLGCAAGVSFEAAALHALLELIERDAAALWWRGGVRGHLIPIDHAASRHAMETLASARGDAGRRRTWLLDISTDLRIPCVAAMSVDSDGQGFACGLAARLNLAGAASAAVLELCQMELAHHVVAAKRHEGGDQALNAVDLGHLRRGCELNPRDCALLHPLPPRNEGAATDPPASLRQLLAHLAAAQIETFAVDLTRPA